MKGRSTWSQAIKSLGYIIVNATQASFFYHFGVFNLIMTQNTLTVLPEGSNRQLRWWSHSWTIQYLDIKWENVEILTVYGCLLCQL